MRYATPLIFFAVAGYVWWYAGSHANSAMVFPFLDALDPSLRDDPQRWGRVTAYLFAGIGGLLLLGTLRRRRSRDED